MTRGQKKKIINTLTNYRITLEKAQIKKLKLDGKRIECKQNIQIFRDIPSVKKLYYDFIKYLYEERPQDLDKKTLKFMKSFELETA